MWLACYTEEEIAKAADVKDGTVHSLLPEESLESDTWRKLRIFSEYQDPDFEPPLYDVW